MLPLDKNSGVNVAIWIGPTHNRITTNMDIEKAIRDLHPLGGQVVPIRTVQETRPVEEFGMAYTIGMSRKA